MIIRDAVRTDMAAVTEVANALLRTTTVTWSTDPERIADREGWFDRQQAHGFPVLVADTGDAVVGFASYGSFRGEGRWPGYRYTVEHSVHVDRAHWHTGVGRLLLEALVERARVAGMHVMIGAVDGDNERSIRFHERLGFRVVGRLPETGWKFDRWLDLVLVQRIL